MSSVPRARAARLARKLDRALPGVLLLLVIGRMLVPAFSDPTFFFARDEQGQVTELHDFASVRHVLQDFWTADGGSPTISLYAPEAQRRIASEWLDQPDAPSLLFLHTPTLLWLWGPLAHLSDAWAYLAWTLLNLGFAVWLLRAAHLPPLVGPLWLLSQSVFSCLLLGQTALLSSVALLVLARSSVQGRVAHTWLPVLALWVLTIKPQLALAAGVALLACGRGRTVVAALGLTLLSTLALAPWLGPGWAADYLDAVSRANMEQIDPAFEKSLYVSTMSNLRATLHLEFGVADALASRVSAAATLASLAVLAWLGLRTRLRPAAIWSTAVLIVLALTPHVNAYQELQLVVLLALAWTGDAGRPAVRAVITALVLAWLWLPVVFGSTQAVPPVIGLGTKALLAVLVWVPSSTPAARPARGEPDPADRPAACDGPP